MSTQFNKEYYQRFYFNPRTAVISRAEMRARARLIGAYADHIGLPVRRMLDAGCGIGLLRAPLKRAFPRAEYTGLEYSEYLCQRFGWVQGSLATWVADPFDLVVCYDVMQYLDDRTAARAIANLGRLTRGVLYLSALTARDWRENCDRTRTDRDVHLREAEWYGARLRRHFRPSGAGFWVRRGAPLTTWEMETAAI
jgi:SAM-dependent methyltransferase